MLPSQRDSKSASEYPRTLSQWLELDYFRRPRSMRRLRRKVFAIVFLSSIAVILIATFLPRSRSLYQAGPVSSAHSMFNEDCARCHTLTFSPLARLVRGDEGIRSVTDTACLRCHDAPVHHERQLGTPACAGCHREHRGQQSLARVAEGQCIDCHADLKKHIDTRKSSDADRSFHEVISGFASGLHPQFALWDNPKDPGTIRFNHKKHLDPEGVRVADSSELRKLECAHCHQPDEAHRYMLPINYDRHCALCHPLSVPIAGEVTDKELRKAAEGFLKVPAPHPQKGETPATVRAVVRDRLIAFVQQHRAIIESENANALARPIPGRRTQPVAVNEGAWVERQLEVADRVLFKSAGRCRYCHTESSDSPHTTNGLPEYALPMIKDRWLPHSVFSHDSHRALACQECHAGASQSELTSQVLMPKIESCQQCHNSRRNGARSDCVECHSYHDRRKPYRLDGQFSIADFLEFVPESKARQRP